MQTFESQVNPLAHDTDAHEPPRPGRHVVPSQSRPEEQSDTTAHVPPAVDLQVPATHERLDPHGALAPHAPFKGTRQTFDSHDRPDAQTAGARQLPPASDRHTDDWHAVPFTQSFAPEQEPPAATRHTFASQVRPCPDTQSDVDEHEPPFGDLQTFASHTSVPEHGVDTLQAAPRPADAQSWFVHTRPDAQVPAVTHAPPSGVLQVPESHVRFAPQGRSDAHAEPAEPTQVVPLHV